MPSFWPAGLNLADAASPLEILKVAKREWSEKSGGVLALVIQESTSTNGNDTIIVHVKHVPSNRTVMLFSVVHRPGAPYPAKIQPSNDELPNFLKKEYYVAGYDEQTFDGSEGYVVSNKWVSETPSEFRSQLSDVFNLGTVKSEILSLVTGSASTSVKDDDGLSEVSNETS